MRGFFMGESMEIKIYFNKTSAPPLLENFSGYLILLSPSNWDDFGYKTTFNIHICDYSKNPCIKKSFGIIKIGQLAQSPTNSIFETEYFKYYFDLPIPQRFLNTLPNNLFSLPEYEHFYFDLENYFSEDLTLLSSFYEKIRDIVKNNLQHQILTENFFIKSFKRTMCFTTQQEFQWLYEKTKSIDIFEKNILKAKQILNHNYPADLEEDINIMLHGFLIATLENYLETTFMTTVLSSDSFILKQALNDGSTKDLTFKIQELNNWKDTLRKKVEDSLKTKSFHNVQTVIPMFKTTLNCDIPKTTWLVPAVEKRHDCAHRAGYTKEQKKIRISKEDIDTLITNISEFVSKIQLQILKID